MSHDPVTRGPRATPPPCPRCRGPIDRVHRHAADHWVAAVRRGPVYRYRCRSVACHWGGLLAPVAAPASDRRRPVVAGIAVVLVVAAAAVGLITGIPDRWEADNGAETAAAQRTAGLRALPQDAVTVPPAGWHAVGLALPLDDARQAGRAAGLQLRHGCTWGVPGADPYRGTAEQALQAAGLPADAVRVLSERIRRGESDGELTLARDGIQSADGQRLFGRRLVASTHGMTLCFDTLVNFAEGHVERAPLFEFTSADGRLFSVIVPPVCGNVSVVSELPPAGIVLGERAERTLAPAMPGTAGAAGTGAPAVASRGATPVATDRAGPDRGRAYARAPAAGAPGGPGLPTLPPGAGTPTSRGDTSPPEPTPPTPTSSETPPTTPPTVVPGPGTPPTPDNSEPNPPKDTYPPQPPTPPGPVLPPSPETPPTTPPAVVPGPGTPPAPGNSGPNPPKNTSPPQPPTPPGPTLPPSTETPPTTPPTVVPGPGTPPAPPGPALPPPTETPGPPPLPPSGPPPWLPLVPPGGEFPPSTPSVDPADPAPPQSVPAPGTLSTSLLGLAALMAARRWRRRRPS